MVGLVVVSHSWALARAAVALASEMLHGRAVRIEIAAGLDEHTFGTDATRIVTAVQDADAGDGVVVLMDLGSAVLSAELALDLLDDGARDRVVLCPAPLVEGLVVAAVAAATGASRDEVAAEAAGALAGKQSHFAAPPPEPAAPAAGSAGGPTAAFTVTGPHGLHARPAARLVAQARSHDARLELRNRTTGSPWVSAASLSRVATLGALQGHELEVRATGAQAQEAVDHLLVLAASGFGEHTQDAVAPPAPRRPAGAGVPASPGIGVGPVWHDRGAPVVVPAETSRGAETEWRRIGDAVAAVRRAVQRVRADTARVAGDAEADVFDAHLLLLDDPELVGDVRARVDGGEAAAPAWAAAVERIAAEFAGLGDDYLQARAADVRAVGDQVLRALTGAPAAAPDGEGVLVAEDLTPADAAALDPARVAGVLLAYGSATSHAAILARARGIPAVAGLGAGITAVPAGTVVALDGATGRVVVDPAPDELAAFTAAAAEQGRRRGRALERAASPAATRDGVAVAVGANVGSVRDAEQAAAAGADLAGLVRTEFLFLDRSRAPEVDEQADVYRRIAAALGGRRITLRTLDVGGDKPLRYAPGPAEANPYLGVRGIRLSAAHPRLFAAQLRAVVRVAHETPVSVMFPMVATVAELLRARQALAEAVRAEGRGEPAGLLVGVMVEVPAAALKAAAFGRHADFLSVGTNDLTQYALAAERGNPALAGLADPFDPGVLRLVGHACRAAGVPVTVCGELAADERAAAVLTGLGVRGLSVAPGAVPLVKEAVRAVDLAVAGPRAQAALDADDADGVRALFA
ncbi:phosphoenolpyruvate--protein phosphotransferase [Spirilliplanes yamanashiensis]|uniref:Phosphocarrier protein HPr n=1 Tax=Spirilliplanes yamanashiensis TaxID=42233 RepID=A0A8J3YB74_9ACTN|nr:phosphoenolpyruvate--protein phosphotransferase [Spirilliplanes yamanashiensis]MDP9818054.1 phosphocarrier protein FPr [Spirilliplanes yamanashiensis]GIJ04864.1 multiphosphoryl transfer protein (MTP) [Spirilliplanes yamanashiensis]